jgi:hypothetical protein
MFASPPFTLYIQVKGVKRTGWVGNFFKRVLLKGMDDAETQFSRQINLVKSGLFHSIIAFMKFDY